MDLKAHLGARVRQARDAAGLTQETLADALGLSARTISAIESGRSLTTLTTLEEIATKLERPLSYFFVDFERTPAPVRRSETERTIDALISSLSASDKDLILALLQAVQKHSSGR